MIVRRTLAAVGALGLVALFLTGPATGGASAADEPVPAAGISASVVPAEGKPGTRLRAFGSGWPARVNVQASTCGNLALSGATDCNAVGAGATITDQNGSFEVDMEVAKPPKPCPCVIHFVSPDTTAVVDQPFVVTGHPTAPLDRTVASRQLTAEARLTGSGPVTAWLGGSGKRTYVLTVKNTGTGAISNPGLTLTVGKSTDPTTVLAQPKIGSIAPGQTLQYRLPVELKAPAFGTYRVKAYFSDLDTPVTTTTSTSSYPWLLFVLAWLLLQPLLLGLYKRRPISEDEGDPFATPPTPDPTPAGAFADDPLYAPGAAAVPVAAGFATAATFDSNGATAPIPVAPAPVGTAVVPRPASVLVPNYRPVFGVTDLRTYLDPNDHTAPPVVAPRIVLGGVVPRTAPENGGY